jgi:hypothetical protein
VAERVGDVVSEHVEDPNVEAAPEPVAVEPVELTGHDEVDAVLRSMADLEGRPVQEHVAVFESAHDALRSALAGAGERPGGSNGR